MSNGRYAITKEFQFHAGHRLMDLPPGHKCSRLHGHTYKVIVQLSAPGVDNLCMVVDYAEIVDMVDPLIKELDHYMLLCFRDPLVPILQKANEPVRVLRSNPTAEFLAKALFDDLARAVFDAFNDPNNPQFDATAGIMLDWVEVRESPTSSARVGRV